MIWIDVDQNTDEWWRHKLGKPGGSGASIYMAHEGKDFGMPAVRYAQTLADEILTGSRAPDGYRSIHMERGHREEPIAREMYSKIISSAVTNGGWFDCDTHGTSPDGLVGSEGCIEIKSVGEKQHWATLTSKRYDRKYHWQLMNHLEVSGVDWVDFVSYCSNFPQSTCLLIHRLYAKDYVDELEKLRRRRANFIELIQREREDATF